MARFPETLTRAVVLAAAVATSASLVSAQTFEDVTLRTGLTSILIDFDLDGTGMVAGDFEGDGDIDLIVPDQVGRLIRLFRNNGDMWFADRTYGAGLGVARGARTVQAADIDNDGDLDVFVGNEHQPCQLFLNDGTAKFQEVALARGITHASSNTSATFGDFDADGHVDLYIGNSYRAGSSATEANILYRNTGGGHFVDVTAQAGVGHDGATVSTLFVDFDADGLLDILCVNEDGVGPAARRNELFVNQGDGTFVARGVQERADSAVDGRGVDAVDAFNDGGMDYFVADDRPQNLFQVRQPTGFVNGTNLFGMAGGGETGAVHFADFDNDGWQDLHVVNSGSANQIFRNPGNPIAAKTPWTTVVPANAPTGGQRTAIVADFDNDGRVDVLHRMLATPGNRYGLVMHKNTTPNAGNFLGVRTIGTISAKNGLGARVRVISDATTQTQSVRSGVGYLAGNDLGLHFGVGAATAVDVEVTWPTGQIQLFEDVATNQVFEAHEPRFAMRGEARIGSACFLDLESKGDAGLSYAIFLGASATPGTLLPDGRVLPVTFDWLTHTAILPGNGLIWGAIAGLQDGKGQAFLTIPDLDWLVGMSVHAAAIVFDPAADPLIRTVFPNAIEIEFIR